MLQAQGGNILSLLCSIDSRNDVQYQQVGNGISVLGVLLKGLLQRSLGLLQSTKVDFANRLGDESSDRRCGGGLGELLEYVECLLVLLSTLNDVSKYPTL